MKMATRVPDTLITLLIPSFPLSGFNEKLLITFTTFQVTLEFNVCFFHDNNELAMPNPKPDRKVYINYSKYSLETGGSGILAVFTYLGPEDPKTVLDNVVSEFVGNEGYHELIDFSLDNPWMRVVLSDINDVKQELYASGKHKLRKLKESSS